MRTLLALAAVVAAAQVAVAADLKVGKGKPFQTIQAAVDAAAPGDRILVGPGFYAENVVTTTPGLQFIGKRAVWDGRTDTDSGDCLYAEGDEIVVRGFTFRNGERHVVLRGDGALVTKCVSRNPDGHAVEVNGAYSRIENCRVAGAYDDAYYVEGDDAVIVKCRAYNGDDSAFTVYGARALVQKCLVQTVEDECGVYIEGDGAQVLDNTIRNVDEYFVYVDGTDAIVSRNRCAYNSDAFGIGVYGSRPTVEGNVVTAASEGGIAVDGDDMQVRRNRVSVVFEGSYGFYLSSISKSGGGLVEDNVASDTGVWGFHLGLNDASVRRNRAYRNGYRNSGGFWVGGSACELSDNVSTDAADTAYWIAGGGHQLLRCRAVNAVGDGFQVVGEQIRLESCTATACGGEGLDNHGTETSVTRCTLVRNRIDLACSVASGATFDDAASVEAQNTFTTGGVTREPEVDQPEMP